MTTRKIVTYLTVKNSVQKIHRLVNVDNWVPDFIVGVARGGLIPAVMLSHLFDKPLIPFVWSTRDHKSKGEVKALINLAKTGNRLLIVDDICDTGLTLDDISGLFKQSTGTDTVRTAVIDYRDTAHHRPDYYASKAIPDWWYVYPWEEQGEIYGQI